MIILSPECNDFSVTLEYFMQNIYNVLCYNGSSNFVFL